MDPRSRTGQPVNRRTTRMATTDEQLRLMTRVARLYHEQGMRQPQIVEELHISQARVSRLLAQATKLGIVRTIVVPPEGVFADLEDLIATRYGLRDVVVVDVEGEGDEVIPALGAATAVYLETTLMEGDRLGISSWSATLLAAVEAMRSRPGKRSLEEVVQLMGGVGDPQVQVQATRLMGRLAETTGAEPVFMSAPGVVASPAIRDAILGDPKVSSVADVWKHLTIAVVGIGSLEPSPLLRRSGNIFSLEDQDRLRGLGAVGDICLHFFDENGTLLDTELNDRVIGIDPDTYRAVPRRVAVAGGDRKYAAIRAAVLGGWVDVLITDLGVARRLADRPEAQLP
ncbi:sugar-binding transcriptional regulator [Streptomyces sp. NBC_00076]|jgi:DNA-binding transcriptional regulator LsrR (DeoR family)|uniref:sugar-binding transcriptional regulator n=1 Tax=Streptomyces sp. NBC_00076 TaxID=2975642 RepID=UPI003254D902|nr:sugar-binding transcriptional regulator [Streptomyces sp. NBC_01231]